MRVKSSTLMPSNGRIVTSGDKGLALELEEKGYAWIDEQPVGSEV